MNPMPKNIFEISPAFAPRLTWVVTPAQAGVHVTHMEMDSRSPAFAEDKLRGNDDDAPAPCSAIPRTPKELNTLCSTLCQ